MINSSSTLNNSPNPESIFGREATVIPGIRKFNKGIHPKDEKLKFCKMSASPFSFFRGTDHLYWKDFATDWRLTRFGNAGTRTWLNGDCHAYNFGAFKEHNTGVIFGLNDFDESIIGDYQLDLWRLAISLVLIARENNEPKGKNLDKGLDEMSQNYLKTLASLDGKKKGLTLVYNSKNTTGLLQEFLKKLEKKDRRGQMLDKWTVEKNGKRLFDLDNPKLALAGTRQKNALVKAFPGYLETLDSDIKFGPDYFQIEDIACRKLAGTGSLGVDRFYVLLRGKSKELQDSDVILDIKEEPGTSGYPFLPLPWRKDYKRNFPNEGIRYVGAYRALSHHPDDHLGWMKIGGKYFGVRERNPYKKSFDTTTLKTTKDFIELSSQLGIILATEHNRASIHAKIFSLAEEVGKCLKGEKNEFYSLVKEVAFGYADIVKNDFKIFKRVLKPEDCPPIE